MKKSTEGLASCCICEQIFDEKVMISQTKVKYVNFASLFLTLSNPKSTSLPFNV